MIRLLLLGLMVSSQFGIPKADLVYTTDHWQTTHVATKQYLRDHSEGFVLRDVPPNTEIEFSVHVWLGLSYNHFRSYESTEDFWVNNNGQNYTTKTMEP